ncbi:MAG: hypothetical protein WC869_16055 [Phycisphaerae bacterium]
MKAAVTKFSKPPKTLANASCPTCVPLSWTQIPEFNRRCAACRGYFCPQHLKEHLCPGTLKGKILGSLKPR